MKKILIVLLSFTMLFGLFAGCTYTIDDGGDYCAARIMVACGGPNIWIDTDAGAVVLRWWGDRAEYLLSSTAVEAVDDWARECWGMIRHA